MSDQLIRMYSASLELLVAAMLYLQNNNNNNKKNNNPKTYIFDLTAPLNAACGEIVFSG